ncbi:E3 SUMO-protein ligase [Biomphalaria pfeifferi]|uniref:E3 SUMO-protein ligase n=1 Tax=Biomphalaria pfeifferi TaxID=112525 RepID=A0AAD8AT82_BIOPF|nr:E3 SUMO-protein ligase [Biomphalaria pfeifferi]
MLTESKEEREMRKEIAQRQQATPDEVKILIDNVLLAIKINSSMLSVQDIHDNVGKYVKIPESWRSKNYAFEFSECVNSVVKTEMFTEIKNAAYHTLIVDESTDISVSKMLILYMKYRNENESIYKTVFAGILKVIACDSLSIFQAIQNFCIENGFDLNKMVMFTSDGASVMLGKRKGVAALLRQLIPHLSEQHCIAHREDLGLDDAWKNIPLMKEIETLLRTVYTIFCRSSVKKAKFEELAKAADADVIAFRPLHEVRWLSRHFAVNALVKNYDVFLQYCQEKVEEDNDPVHRYCLEKLSKPELHVAIGILNDVLAELAELTKILQRSVLLTVEAFQFAKAKIKKLRSQYLRENKHFLEETSILISSFMVPVNTTSIIKFIQQVCDHMDSRFPDDELKDWSVFEKDCFCATSNKEDYSFGHEQMKSLATRYCLLLQKDEDILKKDPDVLFENWCSQILASKKMLLIDKIFRSIHTTP